jgi:hypothetical protein
MKKYQKYIYSGYILILIVAFTPKEGIAQNDTSVDNGYYITFPKKLLVRLFLSQKFAPFTISSHTDKELNYKTNSKLNLGIGATYKSFTLNLSSGFKFLNNDNGQGITKGLDLQLHIFPKKWAIDILGTFIKGYYLNPNDKSGLNFNTYYLRPDFRREVIGFTIFQVPNSNKFSYKASVTQNEWQTKSAGSLLYGAEIYFGIIKGDSALVPNKVSNYFEQAGINKINFFSIGPGIGYAYTLVVSKNLFITGSFIASLDVNFSSEEKTNVTHKLSFIPGGNYKGAIGYNSDTWSISANLIGNALYSGSYFSSKKYFLPTGNILFTLARKMVFKNHLQHNRDSK